MTAEKKSLEEMSDRELWMELERLTARFIQFEKDYASARGCQIDMILARNRMSECYARGILRGLCNFEDFKELQRRLRNEIGS